MFFGLIQGMGFFNFFRSPPGRSSEIVFPLFSFNVGIELGQLMIVGVILFIVFSMMNRFRMRQYDWNLFISGTTAGVSLLMMTETAFRTH